MKTRLFLCMILFISFNTFAQDVKKVDEIFGYKDVKLESSFTALSNSEVIHESGKMKFVKKTDEDLNYGAAKLHEIIYGYYDNKLECIILRSLGQPNSQQLLGKANEDYGTGHQKNSFIIKYTWFGKSAGMLYEYREITKTAELIIYSKKLYSQSKE